MRITLLAPVVAAVLVLPSGCGDDEPNTRPSALPTPTVTVSEDPGKVQVLPGLPAGFPTEIPLYDAEVIGGARGENGVVDWSVVLRPEGDIKLIAAKAAELLADAGFTAGEGADLPELQVLSYSDDRWGIGVTVAKTADGITMTYTVTAL